MTVLKGIATAALAAISGALAIAPSSAQETLRVGINQAPPFGGYCTELVDAIAQRVGWSVEYTAMPRPDLLPSLSAGSIDVACGGVAATNQRRLDGFAFTSGIFLDHEALVVPGTDTNPYTSLEELRGQPVGAQPGTPFFGMVQAAGVDLRPYPDLTAAFQGLAAGEIKAAVFSIVAVQHAQEVLGQGPGTRLVETYSGAVPLHNTLGVRRGEYELLGRLQDALETLKAEGNLDLLLEKWGLPAPPF